MNKEYIYAMTNIGWLRYTRIGLVEGSSMMPAVGFGTLIPDPLVTKQVRRSSR
jgi:hypothetical protein